MSKDELLEEFLAEKKEGATRTGYRLHLEHYKKYTGKNLAQLRDEAWRESRSDIPNWERKLPKRLKGYKKYREGLGHKPNTVKDAMTKVRSFYHHYEIPTPLKMEKYEKVEDPTPIPTREDIQTALRSCTPKYKAIVLVGCSSGMGASEICSLTVQDFIGRKVDEVNLGILDYLKEPINDVDDIGMIRQQIDRVNAPIIKWNPRRVKTGKKYITFSNPETLYAILNYLEKSPPESLNSPLFRVKNRPIKPKSLGAYYTNLNKRLFPDTKGYFRSHQMRKFMATRLESTSGGLSYVDVRRLLGHSIASDRVGDTYIKPSVDRLASLYRESMYAVAINDEVKVHHVRNEDFQKMEKTLEDAMRRIRELEWEKDMKKKLPELEKPIKD